MAAEKKPIIVIKKITVQAAGHHGGSWKVAFADFMTAMMAFFLVMWLVGQSEEVKKSVSDYFSTPSVIEYNYSNYGVQLTLEKLFLDLVNEPLRALEQFVKPMDRIPNVMDMGHQKIQFEFLRSKLGEFGVNVDVLSDEITFEIPSEYLFKPESAAPGKQFVPVMERVRDIVQGLKDVDIFINSEQPATKNQNITDRRALAEERLDFISSKMQASVTKENVDIYGKTTVEKLQTIERRDTRGMMKFRIKQKFDTVKKVPVNAAIPDEAALESGPATGQDQSPAEILPTVQDPSDSFGSFVDEVSSSRSPETE